MKNITKESESKIIKKIKITDPTFGINRYGEYVCNNCGCYGKFILDHDSLSRRLVSAPPSILERTDSLYCPNCENIVTIDIYNFI